MRIHRIVVLSVIAVLLAACSVGAKAVPKDKLEKQITTKATAQQLKPSSVTCHKSLKAKVGAKSTCTVIANELKYTATITATKVEGSTVSYKMRIPPPAIVPTKALEGQVNTQVGSQVESGIKSVTCPDELTGTPGESVDCTILATNGTKYTVAVAVTDADFTHVNFSIDEKQ